MGPVAPHIDVGCQAFQIQGMPLRSVYIHTLRPKVQLLHLNAYPMDYMDNDDCILDLLGDEGTSPSEYTISGVVIQLMSIVQTRAFY